MLEKINLEISIPLQWQGKEYMPCTTENGEWVAWKMLRGLQHICRALSLLFSLGQILTLKMLLLNALINCNGFNRATGLHRSGGVIELSKARQAQVLEWATHTKQCVQRSDPQGPLVLSSETWYFQEEVKQKPICLFHLCKQKNSRTNARKYKLDCRNKESLHANFQA